MTAQFKKTGPLCVRAQGRRLGVVPAAGKTHQRALLLTNR